MTIRNLILGFLSWRSMTGYDLKRIIANSEVLAWSANNNQIYRALTHLHDAGWVFKTIEDQVGAPDRHVYTITKEGRTALQEWVRSDPELPQMKKPFLYQLMWTEGLATAEIDRMLETYMEIVRDKLLLVRVHADTRFDSPDRTARENYIWDMINKNWIKQFEAELDWIRELRRDLQILEKRM